MTDKEQDGVIRDLADLGRAKRQRIEFPDGEVREILGPDDIDPVVAAWFRHLAPDLEADFDADDIPALERQLAAFRKVARLICPSMPPDLEETLPFQFLVGLAAHFMQGVRSFGGLTPEVMAAVTRANEGIGRPNRAARRATKG